MRIKNYFFIIIVFGLFNPLAYSSSNDGIVKPLETDTVYPNKVVLQFYEAVERGELVVFGVRLARAMLKPVYVEYIYVLETQKPKLKIYSELIKPMKIASQNNAIFWAVCAVLNNNGNIVETEAHMRLE